MRDQRTRCSICMVSGCSNGGMVAMALAYGLSPAAGRSMLEYGSPFIFGSPTSLVYVWGLSLTLQHCVVWRSALTRTQLASWPKYSDKFLKLTCEATWGNKRLCDAYKHLVVPAFQLDNGAPVRGMLDSRLDGYCGCFGVYTFDPARVVLLTLLGRELSAVGSQFCFTTSTTTTIQWRRSLRRTW